MQAEEDSEEEWARRADAALLLEQQYNGARSRSAPVATPPPRPAISPPSPPPAAALARAGGSAGQAADADPFALALSRRDAQIARLTSERAGETANFRNRVRALQNQLLAARNAASAVQAAALAPRVAQLQDEKVRLAAELRAAQRDAVAAGERLAFAEHELREARDREKQHLAAMRGPARTPEKALDVRDFGMLPAGALTPVAASQAGGTQGLDVVEATQVGVGRRPATATGVEMTRSTVRAPVRRMRRPSTAGGRLGSGMGNAATAVAMRASEFGGTQRAAPQRLGAGKRRLEQREDEDVAMTQPLAKDAPEAVSPHDQQHGWGVRLSEATWEYGALRERLFSSDIGDRLLEIATTLKEKPLRDAILRAMASDAEWGALLEPVASLQDAGRGATLVSAECLAELLTFSEDCRHRVGRGETSVLRRTGASLARATRDRDAGVAAVCLQVLVAGACGIGEVGADGSADARREVSCEAALDWIRGLADEDGAAAGEARRGSVALVEAVTGLVLEDEEEVGESQESDDGGWRAAEWMFVEKAYLCMSDAITNGEADDYTLKHGCAMLVRAGVNAPYVVAERGGSEAAANALMHAVRLKDNGFATGVVIACAQTLCMTIAGSEGHAGIAPHTLNVLLGVIAGIEGDGAVAKECRQVTRALANMKNRIKWDEG